MSKPPFMLWDCRLWLSSPDCAICSPATRGIWFDLLNVMHEQGRVGKLTATREQFAKWGRCQPSELAQALTEIQATKSADVTERNGVVTVTNRKMFREFKEREASRLRMKRLRGKEDVTPPVTEKLRSPLKVKGLKAKGLKDDTSPLTVEPLKGGVGGNSDANGSGFSGSGRFAKQFWGEGWLPTAEADYIALLTEIADDMETWGGKWRNRWRENPDKCLRVLATLREESKSKGIGSVGGYMNDLWRKRMA